ncbi:2-dehydro-3-deoxyphosphogalactonate aldolase [Sphingomonas endophytica]|jgi:2-dehydro-3-deoxyphosphogalactonate aldolase|uniref:2-dehydro-3-deoxyphosphogalactonate aldolase n=1 Tax=Sphingomonas endophytica TaxID=869719 RepID=A0A7X0JD57_9SPHN|nr:2-dehydro-3-deoxy-6-phosphogalactonate aldolase [Sphingomonas endophytica]MBB6505059.1 2-dehydro-3-deoxyphosphogalactonate aldolase [Sphingomonas endophytica]
MTETHTRFDAAFAAAPLVAILRGLTPAEAPAVGDALVDAGFTLIEVPLNSPDPFDSIKLLVERVGDRALIGAGTVLTVEDVARVQDVGGTLIVSPNTNTDVIAATAARGMISMPGYFTPSEGFAALAAGATALKLFPADGTTPAYLKAQRAVLPKTTRMLAVGGIVPENVAEWLAAGADGFGLGSNLYRPGKSADAVAAEARRYLSALKDLA